MIFVFTDIIAPYGQIHKENCKITLEIVRNYDFAFAIRRI